ncbi:MAG: hypothetical protein R3B57_01745 [Phycisphaerales bacterium]
MTSGRFSIVRDAAVVLLLLCGHPMTAHGQGCTSDGGEECCSTATEDHWVEYNVLHEQPVADRDASAPKAQTPYWESVRDLLVLFEQSDDRKALAIIVRDASLAGSGLSQTQVRDGLRISGHVLYSDGALTESQQAFAAMALAAQDDQTQAESHRMLAQIALREGDAQTAFDHYATSYNHYMLLRQAGAPNLARVVVGPLIESARVAGHDQLALQYADEAIDEFENDPVANVRARSLMKAGDIALELGDTVAAEAYYDELLQTYPEFGITDSDWGLQPAVRMRLMKAKGFDILHCNKEAMQEAVQILGDERYRGMPSWASIGENLAHCLYELGKADESFEVRNAIIASIDEDIAALAPELEWRAWGLRRVQIGMMWNAAVLMVQDERDMATCEAYLERLTGEFAETDPGIANMAADLLSTLQGGGG